MTNQVSSGSGSSSAGSSSGASTGVGASSTISEAQGIPKLDRAESDSEQIVKDFTAAVDPVAARYQGSICRTTSIPKVLKILSDVVDSLPAVAPPHGAKVGALLTLSSYLPEEMLVLNSAEGDENHYQNALQLLNESVPAAPLDLNTHPYITALTGYRTAYNDVIKDEPHLQKIDQLLRSCLLLLVAPAIRRGCRPRRRCIMPSRELHNTGWA